MIGGEAARVIYQCARFRTSSFNTSWDKLGFENALPDREITPQIDSSVLVYEILTVYQP